MSILEKSSAELLQQTIEKFWETVPPVWNLVRGNLRGIVSEQFDISVDQFHILRHIRKGFSSVSDLASARQISRPAVSQAVELLVEKGLLRASLPIDTNMLLLSKKTYSLPGITVQIAKTGKVYAPQKAVDLLKESGW